MSQETILVTGAVGSTARVAIAILLEQGQGDARRSRSQSPKLRQCHRDR